MLSYVEHYQPDYFLLENVPGLLDHRLIDRQTTSAGVSEDCEIQSGMVKFILRTLIALGYEIIAYTSVNILPSNLSRDDIDTKFIINFSKLRNTVSLNPGIGSFSGVPNEECRCLNSPCLCMRFRQGHIAVRFRREASCYRQPDPKLLVSFITMHLLDLFRCMTPLTI